MHIIRNQQMNTMKQHKAQIFNKKACFFLKQNYPTKTSELSDRRLDAMVSEGVQRSEKYNIKSERCVIAFLEFMFSLSFDFDSNPRTLWTKNILSDTGLKEEEKIMKIIDTLKE